MSSTTNLQNLLVNVFRPIYVYDTISNLYRPKLELSNIDTITANEINVGIFGIGDSNSNVFVGSNAGAGARDSFNNTAVGFNAGNSMAYVCNSVYYGFNAGAGVLGFPTANVTDVIAIGANTYGGGVSNIYIGSGTAVGSAITSASNIFIGHGIVAGDVSSQLRIGNSSRITIAGDLSKGWVGIGTILPQATLDVSGNAIVRGGLGIGLTDPSGYSLNVSGSALFTDGSYTTTLSASNTGILTQGVYPKIAVLDPSATHPTFLFQDVSSGTMGIRSLESTLAMGLYGSRHIDISTSGSNIQLSTGGVLRAKFDSSGLIVFGDISVTGGFSTGSALGNGFYGGVLLSNSNVTTSSGSNLIGGVVLNASNISNVGNFNLSGSIVGSTANTSNVIGGVTLSNNNISYSGTITGSTANTSNVIGGVTLSNNNINYSGTITGSTANTSNVIGGVTLSNNNVSYSGTITGSTAGSSNVIGGVTLSNSSVGIGIPTPSQALDVSGSVNFSGTITGSTANTSNVIGGVTLSNNNISYSGTITGSTANTSNVIGGVTLSNTNISNASNVNFSGTITGSTANTSNVIGGVTLSNGILRGSNGTSNAPSHTFANDLSTGLHLVGTSQLAFDTTGIQRMVISNSNVGIGTTSPTYPLDVSGMTRIVRDASASLTGWNLTTKDTLILQHSGNYGTPSDLGKSASIVFANTASDYPQARIVSEMLGVAPGAYTASLLFQTVAGGSTLAERMRIHSNGNVGIGTTAPSAALDVSGVVRIQGFPLLVNNSSTSAGLRFTESGGNSYIQWGTDTGVAGAGNANLYFTGINGGTPSSAFTILSNGYIGINTQSPSHPVDFANIATGGGLRVTVAGSGSTTHNMIKLTNTSASDLTRLRIGGFNFTDTSTASAQTAIDFIQNSATNFTSQLAFSTNTGGGLVEAMRITSAQRVGIGTPSPSEVLDVSGNIKGNGGAIVPFFQASAGSAAFPAYTNSNTFNDGMFFPDVSQIGFSTAGVERMRIRNGNVGIGTSSLSNYRLSIRNSSASNGVIAFHNSANNIPFVGMGYDESAGTDGIVFKANTGTSDLDTTVMTVKRVGARVGIGTTAPDYTLDVSGTFAASNTQYTLYLTSSSNVTTPVGFSNAHITLVGGGGGGGGGSGSAGGGGGGSGWFVEQLVTGLTGGSTTLNFTRGSGGAATSNGGDSTLAVLGFTITAIGGFAGTTTATTTGGVGGGGFYGGGGGGGSGGGGTGGIFTAIGNSVLYGISGTTSNSGSGGGTNNGLVGSNAGGGGGGPLGGAGALLTGSNGGIGCGGGGGLTGGSGGDGYCIIKFLR